MAITAAQRSTAVQLLIQNFGNDAVLNSYVPGLTSAGLIQALVGAIGTQFDPQLTECLNTLVSQTQANIAATQAGIAAMQAEIQAVTVTP